MQTQKDLRTILSQRISLTNIHFILIEIQKDKVSELFNLLFDEDEKVAYHSAWIITHLRKEESIFLQDKSDLLIEELIRTNHTGKRRLILSIIHKNRLGLNPISVNLLNFCLEQMVMQSEPSGVRSLCVKIACDLCSNTPELFQEFTLILETMQDETSPAMRSIIKNTFKKIHQKK